MLAFGDPLNIMLLLFSGFWYDHYSHHHEPSFLLKYRMRQRNRQS